MSLTDTPERATQLSNIRPALLRTAATGGLIGGLVLFLIMAGYNATNHMGFWAILNSCFAAFVFKSARTSPMGSMAEHAMPGHAMHGHAMPGHAMGMSMGGDPIVTSHVAIGGLLHLAMSAGAGAAFAVALALLIRAGLRQLANPGLYLLGGAVGGALLYVIMMQVIAPSLNRTIVDFTPRAPFFLAHLAFGATVAAWVYWRTVENPVADPGNRYAPA